jgi:hypothetical protein
LQLCNQTIVADIWKAGLFSRRAAAMITKERSCASQFFIALTVWSLSASVGSATPITTELPYASYGHLWNTDDGTVTGNPVGWCAATSIANSFQFLVNTYPGVYQNPGLVQGTLRNTRDMLNNGWSIPGEPPRVGISGCPGEGDQGMWEGKTQWIEDFAPSTTKTKGVIGSGQDISTWDHNEGLVQGFPTWDWLWSEISDGEDVEIIIQDDADSFAHAVTLTRMTFDDLDGDSMLDPLAEKPDIGFIDPNIPTQLSPAGLDPLSFQFGPLRFNYNHGGTIKEVYIRSAMSESPIPEPATFAMFGMGGCILFGYVRARKMTRKEGSIN